MKKSVVAVVAVIALAGLGVASVPLAERYVAGQIKTEIERDGQATVDAVDVGLFDRRVTLRNVHSHHFGDLTARRLEASGLSGSFSDFLQGRTPLSDFRPGDPIHADHLELTDARLVDRSSGGSWSIASLTVDGVDLARYDAKVDGPYRFAVLSARIVAALSLRRLEAKTVIYTLPATGDTNGVGALAMDGVDHGKIGSVALANFEATPKLASEPAFKIDAVKMKNLDLERILTGLSSAAWLPGKPLGRVSFDSFSATGFGGALPSQYGVSLDTISIEIRHESADVSHSRLRFEGLVLKPGAGLEGLRLRTLLLAMGLQELKLELDCAGGEQRGKGELTIDKCALVVPDLGELDLAFTFVGADPGFWQAVDSGDFRSLAGSSIAMGAARFSLADKGLLDRSTRALGAAMGQSPATARANLARDIRGYQPPGVLITDDLTKILETAARFVERGGTLTVDAKPDPPLALSRAGYLSRPGPDLVSLLGLSATLSR